MLYGVENRRDLIKDVDGYLEIDENQLDLLDFYNVPIPEWTPPQGEPVPFKKLSQVHMDIETTGLDPNVDRIVLIGLMNERGEHIIINAYDDEISALMKLFNILQKKQPDILNLFNGFTFDLPFIIKRCEILGVSHPFWLQTNEDGSPNIKVFKTAQINSVPQRYQPIWLSYGSKGNRKHCAIIDSFHQVLCWDFVKRKLTEFNLKAAPFQMGLRKADRIELSYPEMLECIEKRDFDLLGRYLLDDLKDTKLLGDYLIPALYYQKIFLDDWKLQSLSASGNGSKWNSILKKEYPETYQPKTSEKRRFKGGITLALGGLYHGEISKFDVASLYPSVMLLWGIHSEKDKKAVQLQILNYQRSERLRLKAIAATGDDEADQMQGSMKVMINSSYGCLGTTGIEFNDYHAAALVTAYARAVLRLMVKLAIEYGAKILQLDTDACIVQHEVGKAKELHEYINSRLPDNGQFKIEIEHEWLAKTFFVPIADKQSVIDVTLINDNDEGLVRSGLKKNYIIVMKDGKIKFNGKYRKRDRYKLEKEFQPNLIQLYSNKGELAARKYYMDIRKQLEYKTFPTANLVIEKKISKAEKRKVELGLGQPGDKIKIYRGEDEKVFSVKTGKLLKKTEIVWTKKEEEICWEHYIIELDRQFNEVFQFIDTKEDSGVVAA